jgi:hypothetical protein
MRILGRGTTEQVEAKSTTPDARGPRTGVHFDSGAEARIQDANSAMIDLILTS